MEIGDIPKECTQDAINEMYALKGYRFKQEPCQQPTTLKGRNLRSNPQVLTFEGSIA